MKSMAHKPDGTDWASWGLMVAAVIMLCILIGSQAGAWLGHAIGAGMH
jgi:hypothetical protein